MAKQSPHTQWSGCPSCKPYKDKRRGQAERKPWSELRWLGKNRRLNRHEVDDPETAQSQAGEGELFAPTAPVPDPKTCASNLNEMADPYKEASKRRRLAEAGAANSGHTQREVAQLGGAPGLGPGGRRFKSGLPDFAPLAQLAEQPALNR